MCHAHDYTDAHDVDEDVVTIGVVGGCWRHGNQVGITHRDLGHTSTRILGLVASANEHHLLYPDEYHNVGYKIPTDQLILMYRYLYKIYLMESNRL